MAVILSKVRRDTHREDDGAWMPVPELIDPATGEVPDLLVRGNNYVPFQNALSAMNAKQARRGPNAPPPDAKQMHRDFGRIVAQHLLLDWRGIAEPFSRDLAEELCCRYDSPLQTYVTNCAREVAEVQMEFDSAAAKNSGRSSDEGSRPMAAE